MTVKMVQTLNFITTNANKLVEVRKILGTTVDVQSQAIDLIEIQGSIDEISLDKCRRAAEVVQGPVMVEDTCLCFTALGELPGPYIKWFMQAVGHEGLVNMLAAYEDKSATAICTLAVSKGPGDTPMLFQGRTAGKIVRARGPKKFGWDPIFEYEGQTYAEMEPAAKNLISHRAKALAQLKAFLEEGH